MSHYRTLGIEPSATQEQIKEAYKKLVRQHHPDRGGDTELFKKINEAHDILKDPVKREQYDNPQQIFNSSTKNDFNFQYDDMDSMFSQMFKRTGYQQRNRDIKLAVTITLEEVFAGKTATISYRLGNGEETQANISIPAGIDHGEAIKFKGLGDNSISSVPRGDLIVFVKVLQHNGFERSGNNLRKTIEINTIDLIVGLKIDIKTINGNVISVNIPSGTNPGTILSVSEHGLPDYRTGKYGNLHLIVKGVTPKVTNADLIERIKLLNDAVSTSTE